MVTHMFAHRVATRGFVPGIGVTRKLACTTFMTSSMAYTRETNPVSVLGCRVDRFQDTNPSPD